MKVYIGFVLVLISIMMAEGGGVTLSSGSEIVFDFFCELCIDDNKQVEAEGYCVDCREYLCGSCYSGHRKTRATRHHVLQDKSNMPRDTPLSTDRVSKDITTKCKVHNGEPLKYYCKSHAVLGCSTCFVSGHRGCQEIENIVDKSENILESQLFKEFNIKIQLMQKKSRDIEARARENNAVSQRCYTDVVSLVRTMKEEAIVILNDFEQNIVTLAEKMMSEDEAKIKSVVEDCDVFNKKIEQLSSEFELLLSSKRVCQLYINMRETESEVKTIQEKLSKLEDANVVRTFSFEPNDQLTSFLRSHGELGTISHQYHQIRTPSPVATRDASSITATQLSEIRVSSSSDTYVVSYITGLAFLSDNRLVITDNQNSKVKLVDISNNTLLSELKLPSKPWDITVFNKTQAAVTLPVSKKILLMKVSPLLTQEREITVRGKCHGIAYSQDRLLVTFTNNPRLKIIDLRGNVIRTIENNSDGSKLFDRPWYVCISRDGETIYVSDNERHTVSSLTRDGVVKAVYKDDKLRQPRQVCTDHYGNVYVCGCTFSNVHMITADCKKIKVILTHADGTSISNVYSVSHCQDTNRMFIGRGNGFNIKIYQLS